MEKKYLEVLNCIVNRLSVYFSKPNPATNDTNEHELKGNMQKAMSVFSIYQMNQEVALCMCEDLQDLGYNQ